MKILLLNPPNLEESNVSAQIIPLGLRYLLEFIQQEGYDIDILNLYFEKSWQDVFTRLQKINFQVVGIPCYTRQRFSVFKLAEMCKRINRNAIIILGGPHATFLDRQILERIDAIDYIIRREGELTLLELLHSLSKGDDSKLRQIKGLTFRENGAIIRNLPRQPLENLSDFPPPKYTQEDLDAFPQCKSLSFHFNSLHSQGAIAPILASRGCSHNCLFCCIGGYWKKQIYYAPEYILHQIIELNQQFQIRAFDFYDDDLPQSKFHIHTLCDLLIQSNLNIYWWCSSRAQGLDQALFVKMKKAGCFMGSYGVESASPRILHTMNKQLRIEEAFLTAKLTKQAGLKLRFTISIGHPGENEDSIQETIDFLQQTQPDQIALYVLKLYPGSPLYARAKKEKFIHDEDWFDPGRPTVVFYTAENSLQKLLEYRNRIRARFQNQLVDEYEDEVYSLELDLEW